MISSCNKFGRKFISNLAKLWPVQLENCGFYETLLDYKYFQFPELPGLRLNLYLKLREWSFLASNPLYLDVMMVFNILRSFASKKLIILSDVHPH